jgi:hypothetical protein
MYSFEISSRCGALASLPASALDELLSDERSTFTSQVKNGVGVAFTAVSPITIKFLTIYRNIKHAYLIQLQTSGITAQNFAFINAIGKKVNPLGRCVTLFFAPFGLCISTTDIRSLWETYIENLRFSNLINDPERDEAARLIGHSTITARQTYVKNNIRRKATDISVKVQGILSNENDAMKLTDSVENNCVTIEVHYRIIIINKYSKIIRLLI